jgi:hypothetical protein
MTGSFVGRSLLAMPAVLAAIGVGLVVAGLTGSLSRGAAVFGVLAVLGAWRASRTGVHIDLDRHEITVRTFWRTHRVDACTLERIDTLASTTEGVPGMRLLLRDGRELGSLALAYLPVRSAEQLVRDLARLTEQDPVELVVTDRSFRRALR